MQISIDDYHTLERESEIRHKYIDGEIYPRDGALLAHIRIHGNK